MYRAVWVWGAAEGYADVAWVLVLGSIFRARFSADFKRIKTSNGNTIQYTVVGYRGCRVNAISQFFTRRSEFGIGPLGRGTPI